MLRKLATVIHELTETYRFYKSTFVGVFTIKTPKGASAARARGVVVVKILNKYNLSILVYDLFLDRQRNMLYTP